MHRCSGTLVLAALLAGCSFTSAQPPTVEEAEQALRRAVRFLHEEVADHGGYVWRYSGDLTLREGEGRTDDRMAIWVQPPGTPAVGLAFLDAYEATGERLYLDAALDAGRALLQGQLLSGGWYYHITFDPALRGEWMYRVDHPGVGRGPTTDPGGEEGWHVWRQRRYKGNQTLLDDNTTASAIRFLAHLDRALDFADQQVHEAVMYALDSVLMAQYPNGAWSHNYDRFPAHRPDLSIYPVLPASYPETWPRVWPKDFTGCYYLNDNLTPDMIAMLLDVHEVYGDERYLTAAHNGGSFLLLARMPEPQPAWCQQYDAAMHPVWDRKFEPPAITGEESQGVLECLLLLYRKTGERRYLEPVPRALEYLQASALPDGRLARFYELQTNRPIYFTREYEMTYDIGQMPTHYSFVVESRLSAIRAEYERLLALEPGALEAEEAPAFTPDLQAEVARIIAAQDERGAWVEMTVMDGHEIEPQSGVIHSSTFIANVATLCEFIRAARRD
ncbi:MAG: polysaccharide lyase [Armatimonadota bacterium]